MQYQTAEITNAMTSQRDAIVTAIANAQDAQELAQAESLIRFVADMWLALDYRYKLEEMRGRVRRRAAELKAAEENYLDGCRKNDRTRGMTMANIARLEELAQV